MPFYAQVDDTGKCFAITQLSAETTSPALVPIDSLDPAWLGRFYLGGAWVDPPTPSFETRRQAALDFLAAHRYEVETGGTTFNGWPAPTGRESQALVNAAYTLARDGYWSGGWKFGDGVYRALTAEQVIALALTVAAHVEACFSRGAEIAAQLRAATDAAGLEWEW